MTLSDETNPDCLHRMFYANCNYTYSADLLIIAIMKNGSTWTSRIAVAGMLVLLALGFGYWYLVFRPAMQIKNALRLAAATRVGQTSVDEFRKLATEYKVSLDEGQNTFGILRRNRALEYVHLSPATVVLFHADTKGGLVTLIEVWAWVGEHHEYANIGIQEFDTHNTGCGDVSECVKPYSSTMLTSVFFVPSTALARREHLLSLNSWCLAKIGGCKSSREFFPAAWENQHP